MSPISPNDPAGIGFSLPSAAGTGSAILSFVSPLEEAGWDEQIESIGEATAFNSAGWARSLFQAYGHQPQYFLWREGRGVRALGPVMECGSRLQRRCGVSLPFTDACSLLTQYPGGPTSSDMLAVVLKVAQARGWSFYQWNTSEKLSDLEPSLTYHTHSIDLSSGCDALFAGFEGATRRGVRKARAQNVTVSYLGGVEGASEYYRLHCLTRRRHGQPPQPWRFFEALGRNVLLKDRGFVAAARFEGRIVAAAVFLTFGANAAYKYAASDERFQHSRAGNLLLWEGIRRLVAEGRQVLDLGRTSFDNEGLRRFKLGWGAVERPLFSYRMRIPEGTMIPMRDSAHAWYTRILRRLPVPLLRLAGEIIYPYRV